MYIRREQRRPGLVGRNDVGIQVHHNNRHDTDRQHRYRYHGRFSNNQRRQG